MSNDSIDVSGYGIILNCGEVKKKINRDVLAKNGFDPRWDNGKFNDELYNFLEEQYPNIHFFRCDEMMTEEDNLIVYLWRAFEDIGEDQTKKQFREQTEEIFNQFFGLQKNQITELHDTLEQY